MFYTVTEKAGRSLFEEFWESPVEKQSSAGDPATGRNQQAGAGRPIRRLLLPARGEP